MKQFYSCAELAALKIEGYPATERNMRPRVEKEKWLKREVNAKGGKNGVKTEYQPPKYVMDLIVSKEIGRSVVAVKPALTINSKETNYLNVTDTILR